MSAIGFDNVEEIGKPRDQLSTWKTLQLSRQKSSLFIANAGDLFDEWVFGATSRSKEEKERVNSLRDAVELTEYRLNNPEYGAYDKTVNTITELAGTFLDPFSLVLGGIGGKAGGAAFEYIGNNIPKIASFASGGRLTGDLLSKEISAFTQNRFAKYLPKTIKEAITATGTSAGVFAGFGLPESFNENYNSETHVLNKTGFVKSIAWNGGLGFLFSPLAWTAAHLHAKIFPFEKNIDNISHPIQKIDAILADRTISQKVRDEHQWYKEYLENPEDKEGLSKKAIPILARDNHPVNLVTGRIEVPFLTQAELEQVNTFYIDQMAANLEGGNAKAATTYWAHSILDKHIDLLKQPGMLPAIRGHIRELEEAIASQEASIIKAAKAYSEIAIEKPAKKLLTQKQITQMMKRGKLSESELPFHVPENVAVIARQEIKVAQLEKEIKSLNKKILKAPSTENKSRLQRIEKRLEKEKDKLNDYHTGKHKILTLDEELEKIENKYLNKKELPSNYNITKDFYRLNDLATFNKKAQELLFRIKAKADLEMQAAYRDMFTALTELAENSIGRYSNPERMVDYLKTRLEKSGTTNKSSDKTIEMMHEDISSTASLSDSDLNVASERILSDKNIPTENKKEFEDIINKLNQLKSDRKPIEKLINCVLANL